MSVPVGLNVWSRLVEHTFPYLDQTAGPSIRCGSPTTSSTAATQVAEGWTLLAYALARYPDKLCSHEVLCNSFRNPAHLAKMVATAQALSGGRVILGIGAGWNEEEYRAYGWPFPPTRVRIAQLAEAIQLIRLMWTEAPASFHGEHYQIAGAYCEPRRIRSRPSWSAAPARSTCCASWPSTPTGGTTASAAPRPTRRSKRCSSATVATSGGTTTQIAQVIRVGILIAESEREIERLKASADLRPLADIHLVGTPAQVTDVLRGIIRQGAIASRSTSPTCRGPRGRGSSPRPCSRTSRRRNTRPRGSTSRSPRGGVSRAAGSC